MPEVGLTVTTEVTPEEGRNSHLAEQGSQREAGGPGSRTGSWTMPPLGQPQAGAEFQVIHLFFSRWFHWVFWHLKSPSQNDPLRSAVRRIVLSLPGLNSWPSSVRRSWDLAAGTGGPST